MEQKLLLQMLVGFVAFTSLAIGGLFFISSDVFSVISNKPASPEPTPPTIIISPKPSPVLGAAVSVTPPPTPIQTTKALFLEKSTLYSLINAHRKEQGLSVLRINPALEQSSSRKLQDMIEKNYWQHENPSGAMDWSVFGQAGYEYSLAGENLSFGNNTPWNVFNGWVNSPQHNGQMLEPNYEDMGLAIDCNTYQQAGKNSCVVVLHLGKQQL